MAEYSFFLASSLEKVFPGKKPQQLPEGELLSLWKNTKGAVQLVYTGDLLADGPCAGDFTVTVTGGPCQAELRKVELIPSDFPCYADADDNYLSKEPGLFPDLLEPAEPTVIRVLHRQYRSLWISWEIPEDAQPGDYPICITARADSDRGEVVYENHLTVRVQKAVLPEMELLHTQWFHSDCLAQYYHVKPFSEEHWQILENFIRFAARECSVNMLLTPIFTPPLDTLPDGERMTIQLVDIFRDNGVYRFDFTKLERWAGICRKAGIRCLEISHLFTQWGAVATPKVVACVDGEMKKIAGNHVPGNSAEYRHLLETLIPAMRKKLEELGYDREHVYFHISDEPSAEQLESYRAAKNQVADLLKGCPVMDALSNLEFYRNGLITQPVVAIDHIEPFVEEKVPDLWGYYCCAQGKKVPNCFFAMPSARNRIMGVLAYQYHLKGFLHWGYNFYNSQFSRHPIDPYRMTHAEYAFPSGDAFLVYPGPDGKPLASIRSEVLNEGWLDYRALTLLESLEGRQAVEDLIFRDQNTSMTFTDYPTDAEYLLNLRKHVAEAIDAHYRT